MSEIIKNIQIKKDGLEATCFFKLFNKEIRIHSDSKNIQYIENCIDKMNLLSDELLNQLCVYSIRYCNEFLDMVGEELKDFKNNREVLQLITPNCLLIPEEEFEPVIHLELGSEWEEEHGMEWIIKGNKILYVGEFCYLNPFSDYFDRCSGNYVNTDEI